MGDGEHYGKAGIRRGAMMQNQVAELKGMSEFVCGGGKCYRGSPPKNGGVQLQTGAWLRLLLSVFGRKAERGGLSC